MTPGNLHHDTIATLLAHSYYRLSGFLLLMVLARQLQAGDIGEFFFAVAFAESFILLSHFGLNSVVARRVAADPSHAGELFAPVLGFRVLSAPLYLFVVLVSASLFTSASWPLVLTAALITLFDDVYFSFGSLFLSLRKAAYNVTVGLSVHTAYVMVYLVGMAVAPSLRMLLGVSLFRSVCLAAMAVWLTNTRLFTIRAAWDWKTVKAALPFVWIGALQIFRDQVGTILLGAWASYEAVAHFNLAWRVVASSYFVPTVVCAVVLPLLSARGLTSANRRVFAIAAAGVGVAGCAGAVVTWMFAAPLAAVLYGPVAPSVAPLIRALAILFPIGFLALFLSLALQALYEEAHVLRTLFVVTAAHVAANVILIARLGALGAVLAHTLSAALQLALLLWRMRGLHRASRRIEMPAYSVFPEGSP